MAYINVTSITTNSITAQVAGLETSYNGYIRNCTWSLNGAVKGTTTIPNGVSAGGTFTFRQLTGGTTYLIHVSIMAQGWSQSVELDMAATTGGSAISLWSWESSNGSASTLLTKNAYQAITGKGLVSSFSYLVWNDMVDKVLDVLETEGAEWVANPLSSAATKMTAYDTVLTANRFNSLRYNIDRTAPTGIYTVYVGSLVYGGYFTMITDAINGWITSNLS